MAKRSTQKRELVNTGRDARYVKRSAAGRFTESDDVGRSQRIDKARRARTKVASGFGDQGDRTVTRGAVRKAAGGTPVRSVKRTAKKR
jgi:hypothetical protein